MIEYKDIFFIATSFNEFKKFLINYLYKNKNESANSLND
jgi:hypothetical protein